MQSEKPSYVNLNNLSLIENLYEQFLHNKESIDLSWRYFFEGVEFGHVSTPSLTSQENVDYFRIILLIQAFRTYGHLAASFNCLASEAQRSIAELELKNLGFEDKELEKEMPTCGFLLKKTAPLKEIIEALTKTYCGTIGIECSKLWSLELEVWIQKKIESSELLLPKDPIRILHFLNRAELFETFLHTKYVGQKRFSIEGGETFIPLLASMLDRGYEIGVREVVLGMAHRGRLNVLANILNQDCSLIFREFEDDDFHDLSKGSGDVKYHKGLAGVFKTFNDQIVPVVLAANPSHLESVNPVVEGLVRAKQEKNGKREKRQEILPILIHGDSAIAGQGVLYETMQLSRLNGYETCGTVHVVINNQIGFTTTPRDTRSTSYCTDLAKSFGIPIFHVNAEDPEGCVAVARLAIEIRQKFGCDVFIDLNCYRKYGHNEGDEPHFTQPIQYQKLKQKKTVRQMFSEKLIEQKILSSSDVEKMESDFKQELYTALESVQNASGAKTSKEAPNKKDAFNSLKMAVSYEDLKKVAILLSSVPEGFHIHSKIKRLLQERLEIFQQDPKKKLVDWGSAELLAYATILSQGIHVRLSGQDCCRGTFSHRHAMWVDQENGTEYFPLSHLSASQAKFDIFNSPLSEFAVLGFEFGYSLFYKEALVIWEAQFGDFVNGAQVIIDQYIATSEQKWDSLSGVTLMLPHGYEGQGPEHSSARIERFLQLGADDNMQIVNCTTPKQFFHILRKQALSTVKKPLILFTPKGLLRHQLCLSSLSELIEGVFETCLDDIQRPLKQARKVCFCSGKVFYDLITEREKRKVEDLVFIRLEQLYPFDKEKVEEFLHQYVGFKECLWVQEEPRNMGPWEYIKPIFDELLPDFIEISYAGRDKSASPAVGSYKLHKKQLDSFMETVFK